MALCNPPSIVYRDTTPKIGDVMRKFAPFLKLYTEYVKNFDHAMTVITQWQEKSPKFAELLIALQVRMGVLFRKYVLRKHDIFVTISIGAELFTH